MNLRQFEVSHAEEAMAGEEPVRGFYTYLAQMRVQGMSWSADVDGRIVASAGLIPLWAGVAEAWMMGGDDIGRHQVKVARQIRTMFDDVMKQRGLYRAQANIHHRFDKAIRLAEWLGFENEGLMRRFGIEGDDYFRYARVLDAD